MSTPANPVVGMVNDPDFQKLGLSDQRRALSGIDKTFGSLSDADFTRVSQGLKIQKAGAAESIPGAPNGLPQGGPFNQSPVAPPGAADIIQAANVHAANQEKLGARMNRASRSPTPFTNAISAMNPVGAAKMLAGSKIGAYLGEKAAPLVSNSPEAGAYGATLGGLVGGLSSGLGEGYVKSAARTALLDPVTGKPTITPTPIIQRILRTPEEASAAALANAPSEPITNSPNIAAQKYAAEQATAPAVPITQGPKGQEYAAAMAIRKAGLSRRAVPVSQSPYANQNAATVADARQVLSERPELAENPQDLISRMKKIVKPGEEPTAADLKRAGDLTQVPLPVLKNLAKFGDRLAQNELNRRVRIGVK